MESTVSARSGEGRVFVWATGQDDNIGDSLLRRPYIARLRGDGKATVWVREASPGFIAGLGLTPGDVVATSWASWLWAATRAALTGRTTIAVNAGEMRMSKRGAIKLAALVPLLLVSRLRGGSGVWLGAGVPRGGPLGAATIYRAAARACREVAWRDDESRATMRVGGVQPDWAFSLGTDVREWRSPDDRDLLTVVLRGDRERPAEDWWNWVADSARTLGLTPTLVVQVRRDQSLASYAERAHGFEIVGWESDDHSVQEALVRTYYARSLVTVGDRLHGLIVAATEGSIPLGWVPSSGGKIRRHLETVDYGEAGEFEGHAVTEFRALTTEMLQASHRRVSEIVAAARGRFGTADPVKVERSAT